MNELFLIPIAWSLLIAVHSNAQSVDAQPAWATPPRLVVGVVVDQMRTDQIYRYWKNFEDDGFKRLVTQGAFLRDAHYNYAPTLTGPGHASIYTGTTPAHHGIIGNNMYVRGTGSSLYCAQDDGALCVGDEDHAGKRSPANLLSSTLADELERATARRSKTIGIAWKDRGAILPIGRTGDAAYWGGEGTKGHWVTSDWYMSELPQWVKDLNARGLVAEYLDRPWELMLPLERYTQLHADANPYEIPLPGAQQATLPQDLGILFAASGNNTALMRYVPWGNTFTTDMALEALKHEELGMDEVTDLLCISYSATDELGHLMGIRALEMEDMYIRLDREIARLLKALDAQVGSENYTLFLTSDHGVADVPALMKDLKGSAGYINAGELTAELEAELSRKFAPGKWVSRIINEQVYLNDTLITALELDPAIVQRYVAEILMRDEGIAIALTANDLQRQNYTDMVRGNVQRGYMPQRSGDVCFVLRPGHIDPKSWARGHGTEHGSSWTYDTHVPIVFFGRGVEKGEVLRRTSITDIAPTISMIIGITMPDAATGNVVQEVLGR